MSVAFLPDRQVGDPTAAQNGWYTRLYGPLYMPALGAYSATIDDRAVTLAELRELDQAEQLLAKELKAENARLVAAGAEPLASWEDDRHIAWSSPLSRRAREIYHRVCMCVHDRDYFHHPTLPARLDVRSVPRPGTNLSTWHANRAQLLISQEIS
ncbi:MAG: hypothetical protein QME77_11810 [bacterium]|nr:hypothetical protein [bacterium]